MLVVGYVCAGFALALLCLAIWASAAGGTGGIAPLGLSLALLLASVLLLGEGERKA